MNLNIQDPAIRRYVYGIVYAAIPILVGLGVLAADEAQVWYNLAAAILGLGTTALALPNTPKSDPAAVEVDPAFIPEDGTGRYRADPAG